MNKDRLDKISGLKLDDFRMNTVATQVWLMMFNLQLIQKRSHFGDRLLLIIYDSEKGKLAAKEVQKYLTILNYEINRDANYHRCT